MRTVKVPDQWFRSNASYKRHVVIRGHVAGVLSGSELRGKAMQWSGKYSKARGAVIKLLSEHGIAVAGLKPKGRDKDGVMNFGGVVWHCPHKNEPIQLVFAKFSKAELVALKARKKLLGGK